MSVTEAKKIHSTDQDICVAQGELLLTQPLSLHFGGELFPVQVAWRLEGAAHAPVVLVLGGISAGRYVVATTDPLVPTGWWKNVMGPGGALDTHRYQVLGIDFIGGSGSSTGPKRGQRDFPSISAFDQVNIIAQLLAHLNIDSLHAVVGASYGAMVALALGQARPELS
jgi:homoserine O-acetyltransferase